MSHHVWDERHVEVQDRQNEIDGVGETRARTVELLKGFDVVLDLGSGTGTGAAELEGFPIAVDSSAVMVRQSAARGVITCRASVEALPFRSGSVDGIRCDRVLYHLERPELGLAEALRVTRSGGRIVCAHPDHESMVIAVPGAPEHLIALTTWTRIELNYRSGRVPCKIRLSRPPLRAPVPSARRDVRGVWPTEPAVQPRRATTRSAEP